MDYSNLGYEEMDQLRKDWLIKYETNVDELMMIARASKLCVEIGHGRSNYKYAIGESILLLYRQYPSFEKAPIVENMSNILVYTECSPTLLKEITTGFIQVIDGCSLVVSITNSDDRKSVGEQDFFTPGKWMKQIHSLFETTVTLLNQIETETKIKERDQFAKFMSLSIASEE